MTENEKKIVGDIFLKFEASTYRYMEAENLLIDIMDMNWFQRLFIKRKIIRFLKTQETKYGDVLSKKGYE